MGLWMSFSENGFLLRMGADLRRVFLVLTTQYVRKWVRSGTFLGWWTAGLSDLRNGPLFALFLGDILLNMYLCRAGSAKKSAITAGFLAILVSVACWMHDDNPVTDRTGTSPVPTMLPSLPDRKSVPGKSCEEREARKGFFRAGSGPMGVEGGSGRERTGVFPCH